MHWKYKKCFTKKRSKKNASFFSFLGKFPAYWICKKKSKEKSKKRGEKNNVKKYKKQ